MKIGTRQAKNLSKLLPYINYFLQNTDVIGSLQVQQSGQNMIQEPSAQ